jgi:hypothetical protein
MAGKKKTDARVEVETEHGTELWNIIFKSRTVYAHLINDKEEHRLGELMKAKEGWTFEGNDEAPFKQKQDAAEHMLRLADNKFVTDCRNSMLPMSMGTRIRGIRRAILAAKNGAKPNDEFEENLRKTLVMMNEINDLLMNELALD